MNIFLYRFLPLFSFIILLSGCYNPVFEPKFKVSTKMVISDIQKIIKTENVWMQGYKTPVDDTLYISLNVQLINPKNLSKNKDSIIDIQKKVARKLKSQLKNPLQFKVYKIIFIQKDTIKENYGTTITKKGLYNHDFNENSL